MHKLISVLAIGIALTVGVAHAEEKVKTAQQTKMGTCNAEAGDKKGDERKTFMKTCLSAKPVTQQSKMKTCNMDAGDKKGEERKAFMSQCLKKSS